MLAQTETQRRRRGRGGRGRKSGGWGKHIKNAAKDGAKSVGTSMAEDAAWCAMGDPLGVVGCNSDGKSSWFAQVESEDELDAALSAIEGLFAQMEQKAPHE